MTVNTGRHDSDTSTLAEDSPFLLKSDTTLNEQELDVEAEQRARRMRTKVILLILALIVAVDLPSVLQSSPQLRIMEDVFCKAYYKVADPFKISAEGTVDEQSCKIDSVQADVAFLKGWLSFFNHLPGTRFGALLLRHLRWSLLTSLSRSFSCYTVRNAG